jgi:catechol 2,3-dioxygenase-like lactoylglutathione lyase family enzyme
MHLLRRCFVVPVCLLSLTESASAQLTQAKDSRIVFGHLHVHPTDMDAHKKFWIQTLGGKPAKVGPIDAAVFPDVIVELGSPAFGATTPGGGTKGTVVPHVAFSVADLRGMVAKVKAAGYPLVTREEIREEDADGERDGIALRGDHNARVAIVKGPDDILVELVEGRTQTIPIVMHHIQLDAPNSGDLTSWYAKVFGAQRGPTGSSDALMAGATLTFLEARGPVETNKGRVLTHIGFEVRDLEGFAKQLEEMGIKVDRPYVKSDVPGFGPIGGVYLTDPAGTYIELTEGLNRVQ